MAAGEGFDLRCGAGRLGLPYAPGIWPSALGFESDMQKDPAPKDRIFLAAGEGFELSKRVKLRKTEQKKALIINTFLKLTEITDKGKQFA